jgi:hypothetical protein
LSEASCDASFSEKDSPFLSESIEITLIDQKTDVSKKDYDSHAPHTSASVEIPELEFSPMTLTPFAQQSVDENVSAGIKY